MDRNCKALLENLDAELARECHELQKAKQERTLKRCFVLLAALFVIIPVLLVFFGISFSTYVIPILIFLCIAVISLSPILFIRKGVVL